VADDDDAAQAEGKSGSNAMKWILLVLVALLLIGGTAAAMYFVLKPDAGAEQPAAAGGAAPAEPEYEVKEGEPPIYLPIAPALTVNFSNPTSGGKYLQVLMEVMSRDRAVIDALNDNMPAIRNDLILLLGEQDPAELRTAAGKQALQDEALRNMQKALAREDRLLAKGIEAVYFTKFVIQ